MRSAFLRFAFFMKNTTKILAINALVAALYVVLTMPFGVITTSSGMQFRPAEALTILPALMPYTIWGLAVGCGLSNFVSAFGLPDIILGSLTTLAAAYLTSKIKKPWLAALPPVLLNAAFMPLTPIFAPKLHFCSIFVVLSFILGSFAGELLPSERVLLLLFLFFCAAQFFLRRGGILFCARLGGGAERLPFFRA